LGPQGWVSIPVQCKLFERMGLRLNSLKDKA
jgi:hypothetical protein